MARKRPAYQNKPRPNLVVLSKRIEKLQERIDLQRHALSAVTKSYEQHMERLANIAKHDMGNAVQNMFATLMLWRDKTDGAMIDELELSLNNLDSSLSNFGQLIPFNVKDSFLLPQMMEALVVLTRSDTQMNHIDFTVSYDRHNNVKIHQPFQPVLQMLHNIIINAEKSFEAEATQKNILVESNICNTSCVIKIKNNGRPIDDSIVGKIFDYGFTTTNGSGIGLAHARYLCEEMGANIDLERFVDSFTTVFTITIPLQHDSAKSNSN
ncbi:MAG: HAMP domain-containing sensor histidine kinase [Sodaliphilus sp.]|nr:HAMP domain-containing sensor histidine kinase [Sodaliphilus sp.]